MSVKRQIVIEDTNSSVPNKRSRYSKTGTQGSMSDNWSSAEDQRSSMTSALQKLQSAKVEFACNELEEHISDDSLKRFVCWQADTKVSGISIRKSGGKFNNAEYYQVSQGKNVKFQAHKLSLCCNTDVLYTHFEQDASHLCHNRRCWRPSHLCAEAHGDNVARNSGVGCGGFIYDTATKKLYCLCKHVPKCQFVRFFASTETTND